MEAAIRNAIAAQTRVAAVCAPGAKCQDGDIDAALAAYDSALAQLERAAAAASSSGDDEHQALLFDDTLIDRILEPMFRDASTDDGKHDAEEAAFQRYIEREAQRAASGGGPRARGRVLALEAFLDNFQQ